MAKQFSINDGKKWKTKFFTIWGGQALSILGSQLVQFALIWYLTIQTSSATVLATAQLIGILPSVILGPFIGTMVDRLNRRWIMIIADSVIALATITLAVLFAIDLATIWHIYGVLFIRSVAGCFHGFAMSTSTSLMVPVESLTRIQGINQMMTGGMNIISAPMGALLISAMSLQNILAIDVITAIIAILPLCFISIPQPESIESGEIKSRTQTTIWQDFKTGLRYLLGFQGLLIVGLMSVILNFTIIPAFSLLPLMVKEYFRGNAIHLSWLESAMGIGMLLGGFLLSTWGGFKKKIITSMMGVIGMGVGALILAFAPSSLIYIAVFGTLLVGFMHPITNGPLFAVIQTTVNPEMQARVISLLTSVCGAMSPIGLMIAGATSDKFGIQTWFFIGGLLCVLMGITGFLIPAVMKIEQGHHQLTTIEDQA
ncbi:MFS transporter [Chloroflexota bacterium]|nr:MFS transporter [Chloroflexota bacterium]